MISKNTTNLLQPTDLTTNRAMEELRSRAFNYYFTSCVTRELFKNPGKDVTT